MRDKPTAVPGRNRIDLLREPCCAVLATGFGGKTASVFHGQYHLEVEPGVEPRVTPKPPYVRPSMDDVRATPWNGLNVVSTFAGTGGSSTGYRLSGFRVLYAVEFIPAAQDSYALNKADYTYLDRRDVREVTAADVFAKTGLSAGELDVLDGSPPCEPFSSAGKRDETWGHVRDYSGKQQRSDDLFFEYARLLGELKPRAFVAENVAGLARGRAKGYYQQIVARLRGCGYRVGARILDAQWLGVPQTRQRLIFVGFRDDTGLEPTFPSPLPHRYTVRDALPDLLGSVTHSKYSDLSTPTDVTDKPGPAVMSNDSGHWHVARQDGRRRFSIDELRAICGFPADFLLAGSYSQKWERLGDSVPPPMMAAISAKVRDSLLSLG